MAGHWKLSPSDFAFLWQECKRCFYLKVARGFNRPSAPFPSIFSTIDLLMKGYFEGKPTADIDPSLPSGVVAHGDMWVESAPIEVPGTSSTCFIRGKFDTVLRFDDGSYGVVDFKTSKVKDSHRWLYSRQLHAYALALERPGSHQLHLAPVSRLGLLCVQPEAMTAIERGYAYNARAAWLDCPRDDVSFMAFLREVVDLLDQPALPRAADDCSWCKYRNQARAHGF